MKGLAYLFCFIALFVSFVTGLIWFFFIKDWAKITCFVSLFSMIPWSLYLDKWGDD